MTTPTPPTPRRIGIVGAGAVGGHLAARLAIAGHTVTLLARGDTLQAVRAQGLRYTTGQQPQQRLAVRAESSAEAMGPQELVILALKSQALPAVVPTLGPLIAPDTTVLPVSNGLPWWYFLVPGVPLSGLRLSSADPQGSIESAIPAPSILGGSIVVACHCPAPGVVVHDSGNRLTIGEPAGGSSARAESWAQVLTQAGVDTTASPNVRAAIWLKLLGNVCSNPLSLLTTSPTDQMLDDPGVCALYITLMNECIALGRRLGLPIDTTAEQRIAQARQLGAIRSSMLQDFEAGRSVELDAILGAPIECAHAIGQPVPHLEHVYALARMRARQAGLYS